MDGILPPWRLGNDAYYDPSIASTPPINGIGRWFNNFSVFGPVEGDSERRPQFMLAVSTFANEDGSHIIVLGIVRPDSSATYYWDSNLYFTFGAWHRIELQLVERTVTLLLDGRSAAQASLDPAFTGELGGFHFGAYGGTLDIIPPDPVPPEVDFPQGAFCYKANHFVAVRR